MTSGVERIFQRTRRLLPVLVAVLLLLVAGLLCIVTAPFFTPDEENHSMRAISLGHGQIVEQMGTNDADGDVGGDVDSGALGVMKSVDKLRMAWEQRGRDFHNRPWGAMDASAQLTLSGQRWAGRREFADFGNTAVYPPLLYGPAIVGWRVGEAANWTIFKSLNMARMLNAVAAVVLAYAALRISAIPPWFLLPTLLLPSAVFLYASSSQDALLVPVAALAAGLLTRPLAGDRDFTQGEYLLVVLLLAVCATVKPPYAGFALVLFLPTAELRGQVDFRVWLRALVGFVAVVTASAGWWMLVRPLGVESADEANPAMQRLFLKEHPLAATHAILRGTLEAGSDFVHRGLYVIGWNDLLPPDWMTVALWVCLGIMLVASPACQVRTWRGFTVLGLAAIAPLLAISLAEYTIWTPPGLATVYGIQPRYWLPVLPFASMLVGTMLRRLAVLGGWIDTRLWLVRGASCGLAMVTCTLPWAAARAFYGMSVADVVRLNLR